MADICWACSVAPYHDYKDKHGIRCPSCGQKEKDDPAKKPFVKTVPAAKAVAKSPVRSK